MAYAAWSVIAGEQPTTAKWNILGTNDASFNNGTGVFGLNKSLLTTLDSNPYKFAAIPGPVQNVVVTTPVKVVLGAEEFDTNNNFDIVNSRYVVPVSGFYDISASCSVDAAANGGTITFIYKNGSQLYANQAQNNGAGVRTIGGVISKITQFTAGDQVEMWVQNNAAPWTLDTGLQTYLAGYLVCRT